MASEVDFIRQQGFTTEGCRDGLYSALMFQPRVIVGVIISGVVLQSPWVFLALSTVLWWSALVPSHNPFDAFFNHVMADAVQRSPVPAAPPARRFSQAMAATFGMSIAVMLLTGASRAAWLFEGVFVAASMSVAVRRVCLPARVYHLLWSGTPATPCPSSSRGAGQLRAVRTREREGSLGLFLLGLVGWAVERRQGRGVIAAVVAQLILGCVTAVGWVIDRLPLPAPYRADFTKMSRGRGRRCDIMQGERCR